MSNIININTLTPDDLLFLSAIAAITATAIIYTIIKAMRNDGVAVLPDWLVPGDWWDITLHRRLVLIAKQHQHDPGLIAHYKCHLAQQARDGWLTFWWRYLTDKQQRLAWEVEAYRESYRLDPAGLHRYVYYLQQYGTGLSTVQAYALIQNKELF